MRYGEAEKVRLPSPTAKALLEWRKEDVKGGKGATEGTE